MQGIRSLTTLSEHACFDGVQGFYQHDSVETGTPMKFGVFVPPQAKRGPVPVLFYLAGLTCNEETFALKAGAQRHAAEHGLMLVMPDTSPRHTGVEGADAAWDSAPPPASTSMPPKHRGTSTGAWAAT
jgi:S-formylglutathione hydrolase